MGGTTAGGRPGRPRVLRTRRYGTTKVRGTHRKSPTHRLFVQKSVLSYFSKFSTRAGITLTCGVSMQAPMFDRNKYPELPKMQVGFIDFICLPLYKVRRDPIRVERLCSLFACMFRMPDCVLSECACHYSIPILHYSPCTVSFRCTNFRHW